MEATQTHKLNVEVLSIRLAKEAWNATFFANLAGFMKNKNTNRNDVHEPAPNVVIQVMRDFISQGRDHMIMPMIKPLTEPGVFGDSTLLGTGEDMALRYLRIYINQHRKAVNKLSGKMSDQRLASYNLMKQAMPGLIDWWAKTENQAIAQAIYEGMSPNLTNGTNVDGLGVSKRFHPNMYIHGSASPADGQITAVGTEYYTKTAAEIKTMITNARCVKASANMLEELRILCSSNLLIEPIVTAGGAPFWIMLVHPRTFKALRADSTIRSDNNAAYTSELAKHPALSGRNFLYYAGFCVVEETMAVRSIQSATDTPELDLAAGDLREGWLLPATQSSTSLYGSIILGRNALGKGIASPIAYTEEITDHGNVIELGSNTIYGYNRAEYFESADEASVFTKANATATVLTTAYKAKNQSSAIVFSED